MKETTMPKIETPGMFRERIAENFIVGETGHLAFQEGGKERIDSMITAHDAAIRAESAELLRVCGEALKENHKGLLRFCECFACRDCPVFMADTGNTGKCPFDKCSTMADTALAALKDAGVK